MPYLFILLSAVCFGCQFFFLKRYQAEAGTGISASAFYSIGTSIVGVIFMLFLLGFRLEVNGFTLLLATLCAINNMVNACFAIKSMGKVSVSVMVLFSMLGGMVLPFAAGLLFYDERMTPGKGIAFALIVLALFIGNRWEKQGKGLIYCLVVFVTNGMSGVLSTIYQRGEETINSTVFTFWFSAFMIVAGLLVILFVELVKRFHKKGATSETQENAEEISQSKELTWTIVLLAFVIPILAVGLLNRGGTLLLLLSLTRLDASLQYPMLTGGTILVSAVISLVTKENITLRSWLGVLCAIVATVIIIL